jgi:hypothetical protein
MQKVGRGEGQIDREIADKNRDNLIAQGEREAAAGRLPLEDRFLEVADKLRRRDRSDQWHARQDLVAELRRILAKSSIDALEPDLIILDEFQRFRDLLDKPDEGDDMRVLAHQLFNYESDDGHARTLLLSATPYKMFTVAAEASHDDHYADFVRTTEFLLGSSVGDFRRELREFRESLVDVGTPNVPLINKRRRAVERRLRRVMSRTERLGSTLDRSGMLRERDIPPGDVTISDVRSFVSFDTVSRTLGAGDSVEYWKSAPYPLSFMSSYQVKHKLRAAIEARDDGDLAVALAGGHGLLDPSVLERYEALDPGNARLRGLATDYIEGGAWHLLWIPPSMPYYAPRGAWADAALAKLTKRLVFSSWTVVPQAVASVLSYEAERRMMRSRDPKARNTAEARRKMRTLLQFRRKDDRPAAMSTMALIYPSPALAQLTDPLEISAGILRKGGAPTAASVLAQAKARVRKELKSFMRESPQDGAFDEDWYWAAPLLIEQMRDSDGLAAFFGRTERILALIWARAAETSTADREAREDVASLADHVKRMREYLRSPWHLGRPPADVEDVVALVGVAGPGNVALRSLSRGPRDREAMGALAVRDAACRVAWGFRSLFGLPEVMSLIRGRRGSERAYWLRVLEYCLDGNLQAVLDEYAHVLPEWMGRLQEATVERAADVAEGMVDALTIRAPGYGYDVITASNGRVHMHGERLRSRFALRFGVNTTEEEGDVQRADQVRKAFNSPFWPFVLVTTSVGQEGLDFHQYCHAIVHWNLPANPVDFEQREGRVHRYKGHAVRKNVAEKHAQDALRRHRDPWQAAFENASNSREARGHNEIVPYWIYEGSARIERYVPVLPLSREIEQLERLKRSLALYRMVFGQPRQEDLLAWMASSFATPEHDRAVRAMHVDLSPHAR